MERKREEDVLLSEPSESLTLRRSVILDLNGYRTPRSSGCRECDDQRGSHDGVGRAQFPLYAHHQYSQLTLCAKQLVLT